MQTLCCKRCCNTLCATTTGGGNASYWLFSNNGQYETFPPPGLVAWSVLQQLRTGIYASIFHVKISIFFKHIFNFKAEKYEVRIDNIDCSLRLYFMLEYPFLLNIFFLLKTERLNVRMDTICRLCMSYVRIFTYSKRIFPSKAEGFDATAGEGTSIQDGGRLGVQPQHDCVGEIVMNHWGFIASLMFDCIIKVFIYIYLNNIYRYLYLNN